MSGRKVELDEVIIPSLELKSSTSEKIVPVMPTPTREEAKDDDHETSDQVTTEFYRSTRAQSLQYRFRSLLSLTNLLFIFSDYKNLYLPSILHVYHHHFAELVHLYNLALYWGCWGHKRLFVIWLQGCWRETIFILRLPRIDKP